MGSRKYDLVLLGATGFTGKLTAEHIFQHFPADLKWAIAGRSNAKLVEINEELKALDVQRTPPAIEVASLSKDDLTKLANQATIVINTVGPYHKYSTPVVEACAECGTHYLDVTGEIPWVKEIITNYHDTATKSGAIMIPQCGIESAPADILTYVLASHLRKKTGGSVNEVVVSLARISGQASGGTLASLFGVFDHYGTRKLLEAGHPAALIPKTSKLPPNSAAARSLMRRVIGLRSIPGIGLQCLPALNSVDIPIVQRTWALLQESKHPDAYGPNFRFNTHIKAPNVFVGLLINFAAIIVPIVLATPPVRWLLRPFLTRPGQGPSKEAEARGSIRQVGVAYPEDPSKGRTQGSLRWKGGMYALTAVVVAEAAATILYDGGSVPAGKVGGGFSTPGMLGGAYAERLKDRDVKIEVEYLDG